MEFERSSGVLAHPTSFPSPFGIGDLGKGAYDFIDFLKRSKQRLWQILPLGPTSFGDSPYQSFSAFAGNPLLISPQLLVEEELLDEGIYSNIPPFSEMKVQYGEVINYKNYIFKLAYKNFKKSKNNTSFDKFCNDNKYWLDDYALFVSIKNHYINERKSEGLYGNFKKFEKETAKFLEGDTQKDYYFGAVWTTWDSDIAHRKPSALKKWTEKLSEEIKYQKFLQYIFNVQWQNLKKYANENDISIIGDIPIFVAYDSADVWKEPKNFMLNSEGYPTVVAGVPPDYFCELGQLWGNPIYDWKKMKSNGYDWWLARIKNMLSIVDILRIDHFRAFESYWEIPFGDKDATGGKWCKGPKTDMFNVIKKELGELSIIAEDLGIITEAVNELRKELGFPGMKVLQFAFDDSPNNEHLPHNYDKNTICYTGTHDNDTTVGWYSKIEEDEKDRFRRYMNVSGECPSWDLIRLACSSVAVFSIYPIQDVMALGGEHRMNTPSVPSGNWQFRFTDDMLEEQSSFTLAYLTELFKRAKVDVEIQEETDKQESNNKKSK